MDNTHGPIVPGQRATMQFIAEALDDVLNPRPGPKKIGFVLLTAPFGPAENGRVNYVANGERADMISMMRELLARFDGAYDAPTSDNPQ